MVKVADFGLAEDIYGYNYYKHDGRERVPIRGWHLRVLMPISTMRPLMWLVSWLMTLG